MASPISDQAVLARDAESMRLTEDKKKSAQFAQYAAGAIIPKNSQIMAQYIYKKRHEDKVCRPLNNFLANYEISNTSVIHHLGTTQPLVESHPIPGSREKLETSFTALGKFSLIAFCSISPSDHTSENAIAIKIPWDQSCTFKGAKAVNDFIVTERSILCELDHPNVVPLYGFMVKTDVWPIPVNIMPRYHQSLRALLNQSSLSPELCDSLCLDLLSGVAYIHENNFCHRDIKVSNCLVSRNDVLKICDFGFARSTDSGGLCNSKGKAGSRGYKAPEIRYEGNRIYGHWSDVFATSLTLCEIMGFKQGGLLSNDNPPQWNNSSTFLNDTTFGGTLFEKWKIVKEEKGLDESDFLEQPGFPRQLKSPVSSERCPDTDRVVLLASYLRDNYRNRPTAKEGYQYLAGWKRSFPTEGHHT